MPQASSKTLNNFNYYFGEDASDMEALFYLKGTGYTETRGGIIKGPLPDEGSAADACLNYLIEEWDYDFEKT